MIDIDLGKFSNRTLIIYDKHYEMQFWHSIFVFSFEDHSKPPLNTSLITL